jgi:peptidoglycan hydrolase-like protein with peptidoglycan-binding domain
MAQDVGPPKGKLELNEAEMARAEAYVAEYGKEIATEPSEEQLDRQPRAPAEISPQAAALQAAWPANDKDSPDYQHFTSITVPPRFDIVAQDIETLIAANRFAPEGFAHTIALAIRGATLQSGHEQEQKTSIGLADVRPNHVDYRCVVGFYRRDQGKITLYTGSTVPDPFHLREYYKDFHGLPHSYSGKTNMLPGGCYVFRVDRHRDIRPALRMAEPEDLTKDATIVVLRTTNDLCFKLEDVWDFPVVPWDNVHCTYVTSKSSELEAFFSSAGCLTVRGARTPSDQWKKFTAVLSGLGAGKRSDLVLLTGREYAIAAKLRLDNALGNQAVVQRELVRLRPGSQGDEVNRLQAKLGLTPSSYFGASTKVALVKYQRANGLPSDGIYSPQLDQRLGWAVF